MDELKQEKGENREEEKKGKQIQVRDTNQNGHGGNPGWVYTQPRTIVIKWRATKRDHQKDYRTQRTSPLHGHLINAVLRHFIDPLKI